MRGPSLLLVAEIARVLPGALPQPGARGLHLPVVDDPEVRGEKYLLRQLGSILPFRDAEPCERAEHSQAVKFEPGLDNACCYCLAKVEVVRIWPCHSAREMSRAGLIHSLIRQTPSESPYF